MTSETSNTVGPLPVNTPSASLSGSNIFHVDFPDDNGGDVVLRSCDGILFRAHSLILSKGSSFFSSMFALPQESSLDHFSSASSQSAHLRLDEDAATIDIPLMMISGQPFPIDRVFDSMNSVTSVLHFADKYGMSLPVVIIQCGMMRPSLMSNETSFSVYRLACRYGWEDIAAASALLCLNHNLSSMDTVSRPDLSGISFSSYGRLLALANARIQQFADAVNDQSQFHGSNPNYICRHCQQPASDKTWRILRLCIVDALRNCPSGSAIRNEMTKWPEWDDLIEAQHCTGIRLYNEDATKSNILNLIDRLPTQLPKQEAQSSNAM